ncbi:MAG: hypothetical protein PHH08_01530, partial [Candidatus ainarchaeum sp.]|nr:hypothetical protein [Candidatus ainarchaeum sp.]
MGILDGIKNIYYAGEDKWYAFWDRVDSKIPVYGLIEKIDKAIPSFVLFLLVVAAIILFASWGAIGGIFVQHEFNVLVLDSEENPLPNSHVEILLNEKSIFSDFTNELGESSAITVPLNSVLAVAVAKEGFEEASKQITIERPKQKLEVRLQAVEVEQEISLVIKDQYNQPVTDAVVVTFACKNPGIAPPTEKTVTNGRLAIIEPKSCGGLIASLDSSRYAKINSRALSSGEQTIFLKSLDNPPDPENPANGSLRVFLKSDNAAVTEPVTVYIYRDNGAGGIGPLDTKESENGSVEFSKAPG